MSLTQCRPAPPRRDILRPILAAHSKLRPKRRAATFTEWRSRAMTPGELLESTLRCADAEMYRIKQARRNSFQIAGAILGGERRPQPSSRDRHERLLRGQTPLVKLTLQGSSRQCRAYQPPLNEIAAKLDERFLLVLCLNAFRN